MSSELHNDNLLDLLYGELGPEEERALREEIAGDPALADEFAELSASRETVQAHMNPPAEVPDAVTEAILAAARTQGATLGAGKRSDDDRPTRGLWGTLATMDPLRVGSVAAVLLASGLLFLFMASDVQDGDPIAAESVPAVAAALEKAEEEIAPTMAMERPALEAPAPALEIDTQVIPDPAPPQRLAQAASRPASRAPTPTPPPRAPRPESSPEPQMRGGAFSREERSRAAYGAEDIERSIGTAAGYARAAPAPSAARDEAFADSLQGGAMLAESDDEAEEETEEGSLLDQAHRALEDGEVGQAARLLERILASDEHSEEYQERAESLRRRITTRQQREAAEADAADVDVASEPANAAPATIEAP